MDYFFVHPKDIRDRVATIRGEEFDHLARVVRKKEGDQITLVDGEGRSFEVVIRLIDRTHAECEILNTQHRLNEPTIVVTLAVSLLRNPARFDFLVEKTTELGVRSIVPLLCERTIPRSEKHTRFEKIALSAMKQCGRSYLPKIHELSTFEMLVSEAQEYSLRLIPHEKTEQSQFIGSILKNHPSVNSVLVAIGPEGGFTELEIAVAIENGFMPISLGSRRLRTETAAISAVTWLVGGA